MGTHPFTDPEVHDRAFLGVGWRFPLTLDGTGEISLVAADEDIREATRLILLTSPGERAMRPDFGAGLRDLVFEPMSSTTLALVRMRVEQTLIEWEPRIDVHEVRVEPGNASKGELLVHIDYRIRDTNTFYNMVFPFYLREGATR